MKSDSIGQQIPAPCLVYEHCVQKLAELRIPLSALLAGLGIPATDRVAIEVLPSPEPIFTPTLLVGKIVNCGFAPARLLVTDITAGTEFVQPVNLTIQEEEEAPGVLPTDAINETVVRGEGATVCRVMGTTVTATGLVNEPWLLIKAIYLVKKTVIRFGPPRFRPCPPPQPECPPNEPPCECDPCHPDHH